MELLHIFSSFAVGGVQRRFVTLAGALGPGYRHVVFAMDGDYAAMALIDPAASVSQANFSLLSGSTLGSVLHYRNLLKKIRPDRLVTYNWGAIEWALANIVPVCPHIHLEDGFGPEEAERQLLRRVWTRRLALRGRTRVILPSQTLLRLAQDVWHLPARNLQFIPNGIDVSRFDGQGSKADLAKLAVPLDRIHIGTVTALRAEKNIARLIEAFQPQSTALNLHLLIAGDGPEKANLEQIVRSKGLTERVSFLGSIDHPEDILAGLDIYASSSDTEQMPLSVLEAMAAGLPVASTDVGDIKAMLSEQNQPFVSGLSADLLTKSLAALAQSEDLRRHVGEANRARVTQVYSLPTMCQAYRDVLWHETT